ncbi:protein of unknown function [Methylococcus capsulatus]|jgi:hypothetical protein|uniref:Uncharacterized protein n=1 Tax=Methylococcus capsulatus TaxID=414 RepID=A0AA35UHK7_METCP|nr:protein of unknown function [Methylococcus capsulatus]
MRRYLITFIDPASASAALLSNPSSNIIPSVKGGGGIRCLTQGAVPCFNWQLFGQVAQLVEQGTENPRVGGSIPSLATNI